MPEKMPPESPPQESADLLSIAASCRIELEDRQWLRLHRHGRLHRLGLTFQMGAGKGRAGGASRPFAGNIFLLALLSSDCYQEVIFDHLTMPWPGVHGPFALDGLSPHDYSALSPTEAAAQARAVMMSGKWLSPPPDSERLHRLQTWLSRLSARTDLAFRLDACRDFNAQARTGKQFDHEWAHALVEFHEYLFVDTAKGRCDILYLAYE